MLSAGSAPAAGGGCSGYQGPGSGNAPYDPFSEPAERSYGFQSTGGGGGGGGTGNPGKAKNGTPGQPGIVVVRYELPSGNAAPQAKATGGAVSKVGSKIVHVFHHPGSLVVPATIPSVQYFLVGGGGAGSGSDGGGGGGAGGVQTNIPSIIPGPATGGAMALPATTYPVTVGRGGACSGSTPAGGNADFANIAGNGEDTVFNSITGGGGGRAGFGAPSPVIPHHMVLEMVEVMDPQVVVEVHTVQVVAVAVLVMVMVVLAQVLNHYLVGLVLAVVVQVVIHLVLMEVMEFSYQPHIMTHLS